MPNGFTRVPDWFSFENQGGGIAITDLTGSGKQDALVLLVDNSVGKNRGLYKVGKSLDEDGVPKGGWAEWQQIPDWFSSENQGAGIATADLSGSGRPDLIVFMIDNPVGKNRGIYKVGKDLDSDGKVTGGWTGWIDVPDWFPFENDGGAIAVADIDGDGRAELIVFMIDAPNGLNQGFYKIGRSLDADGTATGGWTGWLPVPDWFSKINQGAGVAITSLRNDATRDLVFFHIDGAPTQNQAFFKIARGVSADGVVSGEWSPWYGVPGWFMWENQGGGITVAPLHGPGSHDLAVFAIDSPDGQNSGLYRIVALDNDPTTHGTWELLPYDSQVLAVHAAVLPHWLSVDPVTTEPRYRYAGNSPTWRVDPSGRQSGLDEAEREWNLLWDPSWQAKFWQEQRQRAWHAYRSAVAEGFKLADEYDHVFNTITSWSGEHWRWFFESSEHGLEDIAARLHLPSFSKLQGAWRGRSANGNWAYLIPPLGPELVGYVGGLLAGIVDTFVKALTGIPSTIARIVLEIISRNPGQILGDFIDFVKKQFSQIVASYHDLHNRTPYERGEFFGILIANAFLLLTFVKAAVTPLVRAVGRIPAVQNPG